jgi:hypothetical protein
LGGVHIGQAVADRWVQAEKLAPGDLEHAFLVAENLHHSIAFVPAVELPRHPGFFSSAVG